MRVSLLSMTLRSCSTEMAHLRPPSLDTKLTDSCEYADTAVAVIIQMASNRKKDLFMFPLPFVCIFIVYFFNKKSSNIKTIVFHTMLLLNDYFKYSIFLFGLSS